jgi:hypothetical protein
MENGIRSYCNAQFLALSEDRVAGKITNTEFRRLIMDDLMEQYGMSISSAATYYNQAFILARTTHPHLVIGLGRSEDKKGGRKRRDTQEAAVVQPQPQGLKQAMQYGTVQGPVVNQVLDVLTNILRTRPITQAQLVELLELVERIEEQANIIESSTSPEGPTTVSGEEQAAIQAVTSEKEPVKPTNGNGSHQKPEEKQIEKTEEKA